MRHLKVSIKRVGIDLDIDRERLAVSLKTWRIRNNLTQAELSLRWNISRHSIIRAEKAKSLSWRTAYKLFAYLTEEIQKENTPGILIEETE